MGLIIKNSLRKLLAGYPTVSDKYDIQGGILGGATAAHYGDVLVYGSEQGEYAVAAAGATAADVKGVVCATNIKLVRQFPGGSNAENATFEVGEALNVCFKGFIAVALSDSASGFTVAEGDQVYLDTNGKLTADNTNAATGTLEGWKFTGVYEIIGTKVLAEIAINE